MKKTTFDYDQQPESFLIANSSFWRVGDVWKFDGGEWVCKAVNESGSTWIGLANRGATVHLSAQHCNSVQPVRRMTRFEFSNFLNPSASKGFGLTKNTGENKGEDMSSKKKSAKSASTGATEYVSLEGRSDYTRKLKADGVKWDDAWEKIKAKYPGSSISKVSKVWDAKPKAAKKDKPEAKSTAKAGAKKKLPAKKSPAKKSLPAKKTLPAKSAPAEKPATEKMPPPPESGASEEVVN